MEVAETVERLVQLGFSHRDAETLADHFLDADRRGKPSHGVARIEWLESFCAAMRLPIAELDSGWDISDGETVYFCPRVMLADDPDSPQDTRAFVRVDQIRRWEANLVE